MDARIKKLLLDGERLFTERLSLDSFWQDVAYQFYPEMAEFTSKRYLGEEFADHLTTSYPLIARRTLGDSLSALLRPVNLDTTSPGVWLSIRAENENKEDLEAERWLEWATKIQRRAMYDRLANFVRATKEGDHSFVTFGQAPLTLELDRDKNTLLYRCWHLKDVVFSEDASGTICAVYRKWKPTLTNLTDTFGSKVSPRVKEKLKDNPYAKVECCHIVLKADKYEQRDSTGKKWKTPWVSIWIDKDNDHVMEEVGSHSSIYIIPRWVTIPGSQYASSPSVTAGLPDARLVQAMTLTLLEAGERYADPPLIATQEAIRSDLQAYPGGVTYVDAEYDEKLGASLRPLYDVKSGDGLRSSVDILSGVQEAINKAFYLDSLALPPAGVKEMTAFEVGQRISEWIRRAMPIFEPMEYEYNGALCDDTFDLLMRNGAFGSVKDMPQSLKGKDVVFKFESPLHEGAERQKGQKFLEAKAALIEAAQIDPTVLPILDAKTTMRDVLSSIGASPTWLRTEGEVDKIVAEEEERQQMQQALQMAVEGGDAAQKLGAASKSFAEAG